MTEPVLKVSNYNVDFWVDGVWYPAAIDMNYEVYPGKTLAIVGESGSGKSSSSMGLMGLSINTYLASTQESFMNLGLRNSKV
jgi:peptide/nickel transport system ATP-binding protein